MDLLERREDAAGTLDQEQMDPGEFHAARGGALQEREVTDDSGLWSEDCVDGTEAGEQSFRGSPGGKPVYGLPSFP